MPPQPWPDTKEAPIGKLEERTHHGQIRDDPQWPEDGDCTPHGCECARTAKQPAVFQSVEAREKFGPFPLEGTHRGEKVRACAQAMAPARRFAGKPPARGLRYRADLNPDGIQRMTIKPAHISIALTALGALPFYGLLFLSEDWIALLHVSPQDAYRSYGAVIASFMAGTVWGVSQQAKAPPPGPILISNILALAGWASLLITAMPASLWLGLQVAVFWALIAVDWTLWLGGLQEAWYIRLRALVTAAVTLAYLVALARW
jgi:hypothetical protein